MKIASFLIFLFIFGFLSLNGFAQTNDRLFMVIVNEKYGFIDKAGQVVIRPQFDNAQDFSEGLALVTLDRKKFFIDKTGKKALETKDFEPINGFTDGFARGSVLSGKIFLKGYIDKTGKLLVSGLGGVCPFSEGLACVFGGKGWYIDTSGKYVIESKSFNEVSPFREGLAGVTVWDQSKEARHKQGFIDKTGKIVIEPVYDVTQSFSEGLAAAGFKTEDGYQLGFIDKTGKMVIKPRFNWTYYFREGLAAVEISKKWGFIDKQGNLVIKPQFDKAEFFSDGLAPAAINGKYGFIDKTGKWLIAPRFNEAQPFSDGLAFVKLEGLDANDFRDTFGLDTSGKWGYIDKTGKYIWPPSR